MKKNIVPNVVQKPETPEVAAEVIAQAIVDIAEAFKNIRHSRLNRYAIVTLIHTHSKVAKRDIELVLNNLDQLQDIWLVKRP